MSKNAVKNCGFSTHLNDCPAY